MSKALNHIAAESAACVHHTPENVHSLSKDAWSFRFSTKLIVAVCVLVLTTGMVITWLAHQNTQSIARALARSLMREVSAHAVTHTRAFVFRAAPLVESLQQLANHGLSLDDPDHLATQFLVIFQGNVGFSWISYSDEAGTFIGVYRTLEGEIRINQSRVVDGRTHLVEHAVQADGSWKLFRRDDDSGYDPRIRPFYRKAKEQGRLVWLPPYVFYDQGVPGISCAAPVLDTTGNLRGVISVDFDLNALSDFIAALTISEHSRIFLFTEDQVLLAHPDLLIMHGVGQRGKGDLFTLADANDPLVDVFRKQLKPEHVRIADTDAFHMLEFQQGDIEYLASATSFRVGNDQVWVVGAIAPKSDFLAGVWRSQRLALLFAGVALLIAVLLAIALARRVSGPVSTLIAFMHRVGEGDLEARADFRSSHEFRQLSDALNRMIEDLRDRLRLRHSLNLAMEVQQQLLPSHPPRVHGLDVAGHSTYCDETGGDYYDFLIFDDVTPDHLFVALGDVMGHGVAAALVMAGARAVLRDRASAEGSLAEIMNRLNRMLSDDLEGSRFMTMHLAIMNTNNATYRWVSAGQDPAIVYNPHHDRFDEQDKSGLPLGVTPDGVYEEHTLGPLQPGQIIVIGTDGVWETPNSTGKHFGKERLREVIRQSASGTATEIVDAIVRSLAQFRSNQRPTDDVTFVVLKLPSIGSHAMPV